MDWQEISGNWVYIPPRPKAIVHFLGGAFLGAAPHLTYRWLLEEIAGQGYAVIATRFINSFDHKTIAREVIESFQTCFDKLKINRKLPQKYLPIYGLGHSMGCKLHLLGGSLFEIERAGNILISYNNFPAKRSIPLAENLPEDFPFEFAPSPAQTNKIIARQYRIRRNLLVKFKNDDLDQTLTLHPILQKRFSDMVTIKRLAGNHLTPLSQDIKWQVGTEFSPLDAFVGLLKKEIYREPYRLKDEILRWLNPLGMPKKG
ncbi:MAG: DUF1350 domain-containing protein [Oscillatoria sp. SIO1A7]|nr:DUF1350 domain-containing protein [Oscillatoria sp. SIO1A7]